MVQERGGQFTALNRTPRRHRRVTNPAQFVPAPWARDQLSDSLGHSADRAMARASLCTSTMPSTSDTATLSSGRGRRIAIGLLILLLILLPLYLWPLRAGLGARPWATALTDGLPTRASSLS